VIINVTSISFAWQ